MTKTKGSLFSVGNILNSSWGYEQTNVTFYQVTGVNGVYVTLEEIGSNRVSGDSCSSTVMPNEKIKSGETFRRKMKGTKENPYVMINSYKYAKKWNGKPQTVTGYA
jgi:hypothetical protein